MSEDKEYQRQAERREWYFQGRSPREFILESLAEEVQGRRQNIDNGINLPPITGQDLALNLFSMLYHGIVTEAEVAGSIDGITGITEEERSGLMEQVIVIKKSIEADDIKRLEQENVRRKELAEIFNKDWGIERMARFVDLALGKIDQIRALDSDWARRIENFGDYIPQLEQTIAQTEDPKARAMALMRNYFYLTNLHPSELEGIFRTEQKTGTFVYLDSLLRTSFVLHQLKTEKRPDLYNNTYDFGGIGVTVSVFLASDPDSLKVKARDERIRLLQFGATSPVEFTGPGKNVFQPRLAELNQVPMQIKPPEE